MLATEHDIFGAHAPGILSPQWVGLKRHEVAQMHTHMTLTREQWLEVDALLITVADEYMGAVLDLTSRGLTLPMGSIGVSVSQFHDVGRMEQANRSMYASAAGTEQRLAVNPHSVMLPFSYADWSFDITELEACMRLGQRLDLTHATEAMRTVMEDFERLLIAGSLDFSYDGQAIYGYLTHPQAGTVTATTWATAANIYPTIQKMYAEMIARKRTNGPFAVYMHPYQWGLMRAEQGVDRSYSIFQKVRDSFPEVVSWRPIVYIPAGTVLMVELAQRTVDLAIRMDPANVPWELMGGLKTHTRTIGSITPRIKSDAEGLTGIVIADGAGTPLP